MEETLLSGGAGSVASGVLTSERGDSLSSARASSLARHAKVQPSKGSTTLAIAGGGLSLPFSSSAAATDPQRQARRDIFAAWVARAQRAIRLFYAQVACVAVFTVLTFALPQAAPFLAAAPHVASFHALLFVVMVALVLPTVRVTHGPEADWLPPYFPLSPLLAGGPLLVVTLGNAVLLPLNGMDSWLESKADSGSFNVLVLVQIFACLEAAICGGMAVRLLWRSAQFKRLQPGGIAGMQPAGRNRKLSGLLSFAKAGSGNDWQGEGGRTGSGGVPARPLAVAVGAAAPAASSAPAAASPSALVALSVAVPDAATLARMYSKLTAPPRDAAAAAAASEAGAEGGAQLGAEDEGTGEGGAAAALGPGAELTDAARGGVTASGFSAALPHLEDRTKVADRLAYLQRREADLTSRVDALTRLVDGSAPRGTATGELSALLRAHAEELIALQAMYKALVAFADTQDEKIRYYESELRRATVDTQQLRRNLRDARTKNDKLVAAMQVERDANEVAQATILELRDRLGALMASATSGAGAGGEGGGWAVPGVSINAGGAGGSGHPHTPLGSASFHQSHQAGSLATSAAVGIAGASSSGAPRGSFHSSASSAVGGAGGSNLPSASRPVSFASRASFAAVVGSPGTASAGGGGAILGSPTHGSTFAARGGASGPGSHGAGGGGPGSHAAGPAASPYLLARAPVPSVLPEAFSLTRASAATPTNGGAGGEGHTTLAAALAGGSTSSSPQAAAARPASN